MNIKENAVVIIDYTIKDNEGQLLESADGELLSYIQGSGTLAPGLEKALLGKDVGHQMEVTLTPDEAFGPRDDELVSEVSLDDFEESEGVSAGLVFHAEPSSTTQLEEDHARRGCQANERNHHLRCSSASGKRRNDLLILPPERHLASRSERLRSRHDRREDRPL